MRAFALFHARPTTPDAFTTLYTYDCAQQLNVLPDGRPVISDPVMLLATGSTTSTAGSKTHFDD
ncbi:putative ATP-grasp-modified RiPP [Streptomyces fildesensis]|uniref:putative ATP-grasp-modified RiPP n=1 Tax=Streptomyces fildesensis TaxID=375757 RepID=UPI0018DF8968|nr:putative ATP-grasp-modified RiPP [Streptomyces fildesensis]